MPFLLALIFLEIKVVRFARPMPVTGARSKEQMGLGTSCRVWGHLTSHSLFKSPIM